MAFLHISKMPVGLSSPSSINFSEPKHRIGRGGVGCIRPNLLYNRRDAPTIALKTFGWGNGRAETTRPIVPFPSRTSISPPNVAGIWPLTHGNDGAIARRWKTTRNRQTGWWWSQSQANPSPVEIPMQWEILWEFCSFCPNLGSWHAAAVPRNNGFRAFNSH